jgi:NAD(P)-dependent dehydrogenase (short-subunit alcohol dehydrogenase family)
VVNVGSVLSWLAVGKAHSVSKAGLWMATNAFRLELAPDGAQGQPDGTMSLSDLIFVDVHPVALS